MGTQEQNTASTAAGSLGFGWVGEPPRDHDGDGVRGWASGTSPDVCEDAVPGARASVVWDLFAFQSLLRFPFSDWGTKASLELDGALDTSPT